MNQENNVHVVLGAGQIGPRVAQLLLAQGKKVRLVRQSPAGAAQPGLEWLSGDIRDLSFAKRVGEGAAAIYDCMNPPYHRWHDLLLPIARGGMHAAETSGAPLVALDCLYMYGKSVGAMREESPLLPVSKKGRLRAELADLRLATHAAGRSRVAIGRASDFFGADLPLSSFGDRFYERVLSGKTAECVGDPEMPHSYTYVEDVARGLVTLGQNEAAWGHVWHLPTNPAESTRSLVARLGRALGVDARTARVPKLVIRGLGLFMPFMREVPEMIYQWEQPYVLDDSRFVSTFGWSATPVDDAVAATAHWASARFMKAA